MTATHVYPEPVPPAPGSLPECGCEAPEWLNPTNAMHGCANCGRCIDARLCCPGPPRSPHWPAWLAAREALEVELVAALVALYEADLAVRVDQRRKDAGRRRSVEHVIEKEREAAKVAGRVPIVRSVPGHNVRANTTALHAAGMRRLEVQQQVADLHAECCMCGAAWDRLAEIWRHHAQRDPALVAADNAAEKTEELAADMFKRGEVGDALRRAQHNAEDAATHRQIALLRAAERVRLATRHEVAGARTDS